MKIIIIFILIHLSVLLLLPFIPIQNQSYPFDHLIKSYFPPILAPLGAFDGAHYILIAQRGYEQFQQAFFPLYPLLISAVSKITFSNYLIAGLIISWFFLILGIRYLSKLSKIFIKKESNQIIFLLLIFPTSFFFLTIYPESLFLFLSCSSLYFLYKKNFLLASVFASLASFSKIQGVFLLIPFVIAAFEINNLSPKKIFQQIKNNIKRFPFAISPIYGLAAYSTYLFINYDDPLYYYHAQDEFGAQRTSDSIIFLPQVIFRYIKILTTADFNFQYFIAFAELLIFSIVFLVLIFDLYKNIKNKKIDLNYLSINLYSVAVIILPTLTGTLSSITRYSLISIGFLFALSTLENKMIKTIIISIMIILHILLFLFFTKGYFVG